MSNEDFELKIQRLRQTGVGGVQMPTGDTGSAARVRQGDAATVKMRVSKGWVVAGAVSSKKPSQSDDRRVNNDGSVKVFSIKNMEKKEVAPSAPINNSQMDTEESIIREIITLQKKLAALRSK